MSFKEEYSRYQQQITPDENFLNELEQKMEQSKLQSYKKKSKARISVLSAAAIVGAAAAIALAINLNGSAVKPPDDINVGAVTDDKINYITGAFDSEEMFTEDEDIPVQLAKILSEDNAVLYKSDKSTFEYGDRQEKEVMEALALIMEKAEKIEGDTNVSGDSTEYYMLTDNDGNVVKFTVSDDILEVGEVKFKISR